MKKLITLMLVLAMVVSTMTMMAVPASALVEGDWVTSRSANDYDDPTNYCPASGYKYDILEGFTTISPEYANTTTPYMQAHTRTSVDLQRDNDGDGYSVSLKFTILDFAYGGEDGNEDEWISITLNSQERATQGSVYYGEGFCILIRRVVGGNDIGEGRAQVESYYVDKEGGKNFVPLPGGFPIIDVEINDQGQEVYTFTLKYENGNYIYSVCGHEFATDSYLNLLLNEACADGAYVGISMQTGAAGTATALRIDEWQGEVPFGEDSAEPEEDVREFAPIADSATISENQPAVLWDSSLRDFNKINLTGANYEVNEDGSVKIKIQIASPYISFNVKPDVSYEAADFPYIAVLTKNCWADSGDVFYCAGENLSPSNEFSEPWDIEDTSYKEGWSLGIIDFSNYDDYGWFGRINSIRIGFDFSSDDVINEEYNTFDVGFIGAFRTPEEVYAYTAAYLNSLGVDATPETKDTETEAPDTDPAEDDTDDQTEAPSAGEETSDAAATDSCKSLVALPVVAMVAMLGVAFVAKKKD